MKELNGPAKVDISKLTPVLSQKIDQLIKELGDDDHTVREKAQKALIEIGEIAAPKLKETLKKSADPEVKTRITGILKELE